VQKAMMASSGNVASNDEFHKLLLVVKDLAQQLDENKQATIRLRLHADLLKVSFLYVVCLVTLRRNSCESISVMRMIKSLVRALLPVGNPLEVLLTYASNEDD